MLVRYALRDVLSETELAFVRKSLETGFTVNKIEQDSNDLVIDISEEIDRSTIEKSLKTLVYIASTIGKKTLFEHRPELRISEDPMPELIKSGDVKQVATGLFMFQGQFLKLLNYLNFHLREIALHKFDAVEQEYPVLWPIDLFKKLNYFKEFPQQAILTTAVKNTYNDKEAFAKQYDGVNDYDVVELNENLDDCKYGLQPAVCNTCYYALSGKKQHENTVYTTYNKVFRNESSRTDSLDRLMNFSVRDIMFVGDEVFALATRQRLIEELQGFIEYLHLDCTIESANDYFFTNDVARKLFQYSFDLKYELLANIPHTKDRIAIGSINLHLDTFGKAFDIELDCGRQAYSGCIGVGFERLVYALYCQHGSDASKWPVSLRQNLMIEN